MSTQSGIRVAEECAQLCGTLESRGEDILVACPQPNRFPSIAAIATIILLSHRFFFDRQTRRCLPQFPRFRFALFSFPPPSLSPSVSVFSSADPFRIISIDPIDNGRNFRGSDATDKTLRNPRLKKEFSLSRKRSIARNADFLRVCASIRDKYRSTSLRTFRCFIPRRLDREKWTFLLATRTRSTRHLWLFGGDG